MNQAQNEHEESEPAVEELESFVRKAREKSDGIAFRG